MLYINSTDKPPIMEVLRDYYPDCLIKKIGKCFKAKCLFHGERTASMYIYPEENRIYCFGCHKSVDSYDLISLATGKTFAEIQKDMNIKPDINKIKEKHEILELAYQLQNEVNDCWQRLIKINRDIFEVEQKLKNKPCNVNADKMSNILLLHESINKIFDMLASADESQIKLGLLEAKERGLFNG